MTRVQTRSLWRVFSAPFWIAVTSSIGLIAALVGDGLLDLISWICLAIPALVTARGLSGK